MWSVYHWFNFQNIHQQAEIWTCFATLRDIFEIFIVSARGKPRSCFCVKNKLKPEVYVSLNVLFSSSYKSCYKIIHPESEPFFPARPTAIYCTFFFPLDNALHLLYFSAVVAHCINNKCLIITPNILFVVSWKSQAENKTFSISC